VSGKGVPQELIDKAECFIVVPGLGKAAFAVGAQSGRGFTVCRREGGGGWTAPAAIRIKGGSLGFQIGGPETDVAMAVMNRGAAEKLLQSEFTLGTDASVAAGPVGRTASADTDVQMHAGILTWSRTQGLFAGVSIEGGVLSPDDRVNRQLYGLAVDSKEILTGQVKATGAASKLEAVLKRFSMRKTR
jgi:lipid-binding SYLF domain-containing protein